MAYVAFLTNLIGLDGLGESGGYIDSYTNGTTSRSPLYLDDAGTPATNPIVADSLGQITAYVDNTRALFLSAKTADGAVTLWEASVINGVIQPYSYLNPAYVPFDVGRINVRNYEVAGQADWTIAITNAAAAAYASGKALWFPADDDAYVTDCQNFASAINIILDPGATVQLKDSATLDSASLYIFRLRASNSSIVGGTFDFNRDGQDRAAFNTAGGASVRTYWGVTARGTSGTHIEHVKIHTKVINCADFAVGIQYVDHYDVDVDVETSGSGVIIKDCDGGINRRARIADLDNADWKIYPHAFDVFNCDGGQIDNIEIIDQAGYDTASGNSLSNWFSGVTISDCTNMSGSNWYVSAKRDTTMTKSVGVSIVGITKSNFANITIKRYTSVHWELGALDNCNFTNVYGDGEYMTSSLWPGEAQQGCHIVNQGFYPDIVSRVRRPVMNCTFTDVEMTRMLSKGLLIYLATDCKWIGGRFNGNQYGIDIRSDNQNLSFPAPETQTSARLKFVGVEARFNEIAGIWNGGSTDLDCEACDFSNNGQGKTNTGAALRLTGTVAISTAGYLGNNSATTVARLRPRLADCIFQDDQTVTTAFGSFDPSAPTIISVERPELYAFGQTVNINNGGTGPVDLVTQIIDINNDELTLSTGPTNVPLVAGTGTITTSGTTISAFSSSQAAIITGRMWIKNGSNYRRVTAVAADGLSGTLESAFPSNLTTASFDIVKTEVEQIRSQDYGISTLSGANDAGLTVVNPKFGAGNKVGNFNLAGASVLDEQGRVNVQLFGAKGDDTTIDTTAINDAIAYAQAKLTQRIIYFPRGTYLIDASLTAVTGNGWQFVGEGRGVSVIRCTANDDIITVDVRASSSLFGRVQDLTIKGPTTSSTSSVGFRALASTGSATGVQYWTFDCEMQNVYQGWLFDETGKSLWAGTNQISSHAYLNFINPETLPTSGTNPTYNGINFDGPLNLHCVLMGGRLRGSNRPFRAGKDQAYCSVGDFIAIGTHFLGGDYSVELLGGSDASCYNENVNMISCQYECNIAPLHLTRMNNCRFSGANTNTLAPVFVSCDEDSIVWELRGSANIPGTSPARNLLTNGGKRFWQRGTSFVPSATIFMDDRWKGRRASNAAGSTYSRQAGFSKAQYCMRMQRDSGNAATDALIYGHQIESAECYELAGRRVTVSADVRVGANYSGGTLTVNVFTGTGVDEVMSVASGFATGSASTAPTAQALSTTATRIRWPSFTLASNATEVGLAFVWTPTGTAGAADYVEITNIKFEVSAVGTRFFNPPLEEEFAVCRRFYQKSFDLATTPAQSLGNGTGEETFIATIAGAVTNRSHRIKFSPRMRATTGLAVTLYNSAAANAQIRDQTAAADTSAAATANLTESGFHVTCTGNAGTTVGGVLGFHWAADAEID